MIKKIAAYNLLTFFFSLIHIIFTSFFSKNNFFFVLKIYVFLFPVNNFFFFVCLFMKNKYKYTIYTYIYMLCSVLQLLYSIFIFFYLITDCFPSFLLSKALIHFIFSYFVILFFRVSFLIK